MQSNTMKRRGNKWTINELLSLQREYELLELTIQEIAYRHQRSVTGILCKLEAEGFINSWDEARGFLPEDIKENNNIIHENIDNNVAVELLQEPISETYNENNEIDVLSDRIWNLETSVKQIGTIDR